MEYRSIKKKFSEKGLKVTPQRISILNTITGTDSHPTAEEIYRQVVKDHPSVSLGTVYKTLEVFVDKGIIKTVKTDHGKMRYDAELKKHHHIYDDEGNEIQDYYDDKLNKMLDDYFSKNQIDGFEIKDIRLNIIGRKKSK